MISRDLAEQLRPLLEWAPRNGDQFYIPRPEIRDSVFTVSDMVVELIVKNGESRFHFNGTVEWALDSVESDDVVWLPREDQLRELLAESFLSLDHTSDGYVVTARAADGAFHTGSEPTAAEAYGRALLQVRAAALTTSAR